MSGDAYLRANLRRFYLYCFLANLQLWLPVWVLYLQRERGLSIGQVTALDAPFWLVAVLAQAPTGAFADRWGRRTSLVTGCLLYAAAITVFAIATSYPVILASYILWAVSIAFTSGADMAFLYDNLAALGETDRYQRVAGRVFGLSAAATVIGLTAGSPLAAVTRLDVPILSAAAIYLLSAAVAWGLREPPHTRTGGVGLFGTVGRGVSTVWREPRLRYMIGFTCVVQAAAFAPIIFVQPFLAQYGAPLGMYGVLQAPGRICAIVAAVFAYRVARRLGEQRVLLAIPLWLCSSLLLLAAIRHPLAFVSFPLLALGIGVANPLLSGYLNRYIPAEQRATVLSLAQLGTSLLLIGFEPLMGAAAQAHGIAAAFAVATAFVGVGGALTLGPWLAAVRRATAVSRTNA